MDSSSAEFINPNLRVIVLGICCLYYFIQEEKDGNGLVKFWANLSKYIGQRSVKKILSDSDFGNLCFPCYVFSMFSVVGHGWVGLY